MSDPSRKGGNLFDMAKEGTKVPEDAGKPNVIPAGQKPGKKETGGGLEEQPLGSTSLGEVVSASGGELPEDIGQKYSRGGGTQRAEPSKASHGGRNQP